MAAPRRSSKDPEKIKRIMESALRIFARSGYRETKTDEIAQAANVSKGTLFHYYKNKANLYLETLRSSISRVSQAADYSVWTDSKDLVEMVVRATKYKIQLQLKYPEDFRHLLNAYALSSSLPAKLRTEIAQLYAKNTKVALDQVIEPVLKKLPVRADLPLPVVEKAITALEEVITQEARDFIKEHPTAQIADLEPVITHARMYMEILQRGFMADSH